MCQSKVKSIKATNDLEAPSPYISAPSCQLWSSRESLRKDLSRQHNHFSPGKERKSCLKKSCHHRHFFQRKKVEHKIFSCIKFNLRSSGLWKGMVKWEDWPLECSPTLTIVFFSHHLFLSLSLSLFLSLCWSLSLIFGNEWSSGRDWPIECSTTLTIVLFIFYLF